jgi:putative FmdB family regulatory protein
MPIYDYECQMCGHIHERIERAKDQLSKQCPACGLVQAKRIISATGQYCGNDDATWLKSVREVVGDETREGRAFLRDPTRSNYRAWLKREGLRPMEPGERPHRVPLVDDRRITRKLIENHRKRTAITIGSRR